MKKKEIGLTKELYETIISIVDERVKSIKVSREEYDKLRDAVYELAQAQKRTEERIEILSQRLDELAQAQKRTEERIEELAQAQKRTEDAVQQLSRAVGALSDLIGYSLEDIARVVLPGYLERHFEIKIGELERRFFVVDSEEIEVNLYAEGERKGKPLVVIGECKSRIYERDVESFYSSIKPLIKTLDKEPVLFLFGFLIHPSASRSASDKNILLVASYQR